MPPKFWNSEKLLGLTAILISLGTLFTVVFQTNLMRKQQYAAALPYLEIWPNRPNSESASLWLINNGLGPAFVKKVQVVYQGKVYPGDLVRFFDLDWVQREDTLREYTYASVSPGRLIPPGEKVEMLKVTDSLKDFDIVKKWLFERGVKLEVIFASVYDEYWLATDFGAAPTPCDNLKNCGTPSSDE